MKKIIKDTLFVFVVFVVLVVFAHFIIDAILTVVLGSMVGKSNISTVSTVVAQITVLILYRAHSSDKTNCLGKIRPIEAKDMLLMIVLGFSFQYVWVFCAAGIYSALEMSAINVIPKSGLEGDFVFLIIGSGCITPIFEEIAYRHVLYGNVRQEKSPLFSVIYSSFVFALVHFNIYGFPKIFIIGCVLAVVYEKYRDIRYNIVVHAVCNIMYVIAAYHRDFFGKILSYSVKLDFTLSAVCLILFICIMRRVLRHTVKGSEGYEDV